jgi:drug/metabolite transporter (DMT)-like permease
MLALLSAASFSTSGSFARSLTAAGWSPSAAVVARIGAAAVMLAIPGILVLRGRWRSLRDNGITVVLYGLIPVAGGQICFFFAIQHLPVGVALLFEYLGTVLVVGWMWLRHGHRPRTPTVIGAVVALLGLALVLDITGNTRVELAGVLWALGGAVGLASYFVLSGDGEGDLPPIALASAGMVVGSIALAALGGAGILPMHARFATVDLGGSQVSWLVPVVGMSLFAAAIAYVAGIAATRRLGPKLASFVGLTEVLFAVLFAWLVLGELPTYVQLAGGVLIIAGVAVIRMDEERRPRRLRPAQTGSDRLRSSRSRRSRRRDAAEPDRRSPIAGGGDPDGSAGGAGGSAPRGIDRLRRACQGPIVSGCPARSRMTCSRGCPRPTCTATSTARCDSTPCSTWPASTASSCRRSIAASCSA